MPLMMYCKVLHPEDQGTRGDRWLQMHWPHLPFSLIQRGFRRGIIRVDGKKTQARALLHAGSRITFPDAWTQAPLRETLPHQDAWVQKFLSYIVYQDQHIVVLNKPAQVAIQGGTQSECNIDSMARAWCQSQGKRPPFLVHRLDKGTSGLVVMALTPSMARRLSEAFRTHKVEKHYRAVIARPATTLRGIIRKPLCPALGATEKIMVHATGKEAITAYEVFPYPLHQNCYGIKLWPKTGRTHQLRVHCAAENMPILGDERYGGSTSLRPTLTEQYAQIYLHHYHMAIPSLNLVFTAPWPKHFQPFFLGPAEAWAKRATPVSFDACVEEPSGPRLHEKEKRS